MFIIVDCIIFIILQCSLDFTSINQECQDFSITAYKVIRLFNSKLNLKNQLLVFVFLQKLGLHLQISVK